MAYSVVQSPWYTATGTPKKPPAPVKAPVAAKAPAASKPVAAAPRNTTPPPAASSASSYAGTQTAAMTGQPVAQQTSFPPMVGSYTQPSSYTPPAAGGALGGLQTATAPGNTNSTFINGSQLGREMDTLSSGSAGPLRTDLGTRTPPSLAALLQGLKY